MILLIEAVHDRPNEDPRYIPSAGFPQHEEIWAEAFSLN